MGRMTEGIGVYRELRPSNMREVSFSGEYGLGAIDEEERGKARGFAWGRPEAPDNRG